MTVHWYVVPWSNGTLPYPHRMIPNDWYPDKVNPKNLGEHSLEPRPFDGWGRIVPPVPSDHICGTAEDFSNGCSVNDPRPPLERGPDGIPTCCRAAGRGGMVMGGAAGVRPGPFGGAVMGGAQLYNAGYAECIGQGLQAADSLPRIILPLDSYAEQWIGLSPVTVGNTYRFRIWDPTGNRLFAGMGGLGCAFPFTEWVQSFGPGSQYYEFTQTIPTVGSPMNVVVAFLPGGFDPRHWLLAIDEL